MAFFPPIPLIRKNLILRKLRGCGAFSAASAKTFAEAGVIHPNGFPQVTEKLIRDRTLARTAEGKYYIL